jgi:excisionase family DNA binding protein
MSFETALNEERLFNNLPEVLTADQVAELLSVKRMTVYNWKYKRKMIKEMPEDLFIGNGRPLRIKTSALRKWLTVKSC